MRGNVLYIHFPGFGSALQKKNIFTPKWRAKYIQEYLKGALDGYTL
jgi:hypothetical protein